MLHWPLATERYLSVGLSLIILPLERIGSVSEVCGAVPRVFELHQLYVLQLELYILLQCGQPGGRVCAFLPFRILPHQQHLWALYEHLSYLQRCDLVPHLRAARAVPRAVSH